MIELIPITSYFRVLSSSTNRSSVGKSKSVHGALRFTWSSISPQERKKARNEKPCCTRVTWLWQSSIGLMTRLPY